MNKCECSQCKNREYDISEYLVLEDDLKILDNERPLGISGHLRVKDEAMSLAEYIDSCIDFLDELIITYNTSSDNTEEILKNYEKKYPEKIKLFHYKPNIIRYNKDEYNTKYSQIHYLDNYYNYGLIKIKYKYYVKIDADQIYFTDKLLKLRELLILDINQIKLSNNINKLLLINKIAWCIPIKKLRNKFRTYCIRKYFNKDKNYIYNGDENILSLDDFILLSRKRHSDKNISYDLAGFNLILHNNKLYLDTYWPMNGGRFDHVLYQASYSNKYFMNEIFEVNQTPHNRIILGMFWVHFGNIKHNFQYDDSFYLLEYNDIKNSKVENFSHKMKNIDNDDKIEKYIRDNTFIKYFDEDKKYLNNVFYNKYLTKPLDYAIKNNDELVNLYGKTIITVK